MRGPAGATSVALLLAACGGGEAEPVKLAGPPCPTLSAAAFQSRGIAPEEDVDLGDATLRFRFGRAECKGTGTSGGGWNSTQPVCQLSSPGLLHLTLGNGEDVYFDPGVGRAVTVAVGPASAQCVLDPEATS